MNNTTEEIKAKSSENDAAKKSSKPTQKVKKHRIAKYFRDLKSEVKKVVWPSKKTVINNTGVVLIVMAIAGLFLFGIDVGARKLLELILGW